MGNKTGKVQKSKEKAYTDRRKMHQQNLVTQNAHKERNDSNKDREASSERETKNMAEPSVESWSKPNFDYLIRKKDVETDPLQIVFNKVIEDRNVDTDKTSLLYTTSKEKYLIKLLTDGHAIPADIISKVFDRFFGTQARMLNDNYGYCCGFILTKDVFQMHDFTKCTTFHRLNADLVCHRGNIFYPVDLLSDPFGKWNPKGMVEDKQEVQQVYDMILQRWPKYQELFGPDISKYLSVSERYLIKLINSGHNVPQDIIAHVVNGCKNKAHIINESYGCCYGFILTTKEFTSHDAAKKLVPKGKREIGRVYGPGGKIVRNPESENFEHCDANHDLNKKLKCCFGVLFYEQVTCQTPCKTLRTQRHLEDNIPIPTIGKVKDVYGRIKFKRSNDWYINHPFDWYDTMHAWEKYLIKLISSGHQVSIDIISHAIDGCHTKAHQLDENFGCCYGFILTKEEFMRHQFEKCTSDHDINDDLRCDHGWVYHVKAPEDCPFYDDRHLGGGPRRLQKVKGTVPQNDAPIARPPPPPAPPPPDVLDQ